MRSRVDDDPNVVVLLGMSRMQLGFVPSVFEKELPRYHVVNLSQEGAASMATPRTCPNLSADFTLTA